MLHFATSSSCDWCCTRGTIDENALLPCRAAPRCTCTRLFYMRELVFGFFLVHVVENLLQTLFFIRNYWRIMSEYFCSDVMCDKSVSPMWCCCYISPRGGSPVVECAEGSNMGGNRHEIGWHPGSPAAAFPLAGQLSRERVCSALQNCFFCC